MKVYWVQTDVDNYCRLAQNLSSYPFLVANERHRGLCSCRPVTNALTPPDVYVEYPKLPRGDFWSFAPFSTFAMPSNTVEKVRSFLEDAGELLTVPYKTEIFTVLNVLKCADCVDPQTEALGILHRSYIASRVPSGIFRDPNGVYMFVSEFTGDPATEFKAFVEDQKMTGLIFREVWSEN